MAMSQGRERLVFNARKFQAFAAEAHREATECAGRLDRFAAGFQHDAARLSRRARECLFELIGAEPEGEAR